MRNFNRHLLALPFDDFQSQSGAAGERRDAGEQALHGENWRGERRRVTGHSDYLEELPLRRIEILQPPIKWLIND
jgi:hypothetical protein